MPSSRRAKSASLTLRLCAVLAAGAAALSGVVTIAGVEEAARNQESALHERQLALGESIARRVAPLLERDDEVRLAVVAACVADLATARVLVLDQGGIVRLDTGNSERGHRLALVASDGLTSRALGRERFEVLAPALGNAGFVGEVRLRYSTSGLPPVGFPWTLFGVVFLCCATLISIAGWMVHSWVVRLRRIAEHARSLARGEMPVTAHSRDGGAVADVHEAILELRVRGEQSARDARSGCLLLARELVHALELRGHVPVGRPERVRRHAITLAEAAGLSSEEVVAVAEAGLVLDLGKSGVRPTVFQAPHQLDEIERASLREHPVRGASLLAALPELVAVAQAVRHQEERWDGGGSPDALRGERIPVASRVLAIASAYDLFLTGDAWHPALPWPDALDAIRDQAGGAFDPQLVQIFESIVRQSPPPARSRVLVPALGRSLTEHGSIDAHPDAVEGGTGPIAFGDAPLEVFFDEDIERDED
ncbi:MAG: HD-GYP domain-containing protein [Planctomycetota bacterium]